MITKDDFNLTEEQLESASQAIREQWGAEVDDKLENLLEHQILAEDQGIESTEQQRVIVHYKPAKPFDEFHEEFGELVETYQKRDEAFEFQEFDEFERLVDEATESLSQDLQQESVAIEEPLRLANALVVQATPAQIRQMAQRGDVERLEADKPLKLELDQSAVTVGASNARTEGLVGSGRGVIIAVLDGEVDADHPDLKGRVVRKRNYTQEEWGNPHDHGTHVAGIIAGNGSKYKGMAPEAIIWSYKIMPSKAKESAQGFKGADAIEDVVKDMKDGVRIANCSWGVQSAPLDGTSVWAKTAERAAKLGLVLVKSVGNNGRDGPRTLTSPADAHGEVIVVGASSHDGTDVMNFSSRGPTADNRPKPDILAPGDKIFSAKPGSRHQPMSGTSMATPHIAGIAALLLERHPQLQPWQIKKILMDSAKALRSENDPNVQGKGLVDVVKALQTAGQPVSEEKKITYTLAVKQRKLVEQLAIPVKNTGADLMQTVKGSLVAPANGIRITTAEQDYGTLRIGAEATREFEIEAVPTAKPGRYPLTLKVDYTTPAGEKKTQSYKVTHEVPGLSSTVPAKTQ